MLWRHVTIETFRKLLNICKIFRQQYFGGFGDTCSWFFEKKKTLTTHEDNDVASRQRAWENGFVISYVMTTGGQRLKGFVTLRTAL